jgi:hypothetical protein
MTKSAGNGRASHRAPWRKISKGALADYERLLVEQAFEAIAALAEKL